MEDLLQLPDCVPFSSICFRFIITHLASTFCYGTFVSAPSPRGLNSHASGANVLSRMADLSNQWGDHLVPSDNAVAALTALTAHQVSAETT